jgi:hypothetical protein
VPPAGYPRGYGYNRGYSYGQVKPRNHHAHRIHVRPTTEPR